MRKNDEVAEVYKGWQRAKINGGSKTSAEPNATAEPTVKGGPKGKAESKVKAEPKVNAESKVTAESKIKAEPKVKAESKIKAEPKVKAEPSIKRKLASKTKTMDDAEDRVTRGVTVVYNIYSKQLSDQYRDEADNLRPLLCVEGGIVWGGFPLWSQFGVTRIDDAQEQLQLSFGWRARDKHEALRFGRGCAGEIEFFGDNQVRGTFFNILPEPISFARRRKPGPLWCGRSAYSFKQEWDGFVTEA